MRKASLPDDAVHPFGAEWMNGYETADGYTILLDTDTGFWHYAILDDDGQLVPSELLPSQDDPSALPKHLRPTPDESGGDHDQDDTSAHLATTFGCV